MKTVKFTTKPDRAATQTNADAWIHGRSPTQPTKRFTIDVPADLHKRMKTQCVANGINMSDLMRSWIEERFPVQGRGGESHGREYDPAASQKDVPS